MDASEVLAASGNRGGAVGTKSDGEGGEFERMEC